MKQNSVILSLIRYGLDKELSQGFKYNKDINWSEIEAFAKEQGLSGVVLDGIDKVPDVASSLPAVKKLEWIGNVLQNYEHRYAQYKQAIASLASFYNAHGFKMMVLKGYGCSLDWPKPNHRPCGDIDIWLFGEQVAADKVIKKEMGINVDTSHHHHTTFEWDGFFVENHYDFINTKDLKTSKSMEAIFKELGQDDSNCIEVNGEKVYLPSPDLHALFLIRHLALHFASVNINLRQLIDWAFFVEKHTKEINWTWLIETLEKYHMLDFYNCINAICVGDLGYSVKIFPNVQFDPSLKDRVVRDILEPKYVAEEPKGFVRRLHYKYVRWQGNAWKQNLCFGESRRAIFWRSLWAHIIKPAHL